MLTLLAGLVFSFSNIFCDWALVAEFIVKHQVIYGTSTLDIAPEV